MIYDCISFCNTLEVLDIRLNELDPYVDKFVITEAPVTFTGRPKKLYFDENRDRYAKFNDKIIHVVAEVIPDLPELSRHDNVFRRKTMYKNTVKLGLGGCKDDDIIMFSDADEIPNGEHVKRFLEIPFGEHDPQFATFHMIMYYWYLNWYWTNRWPATVIARYKYIRDTLKLDFDRWRTNRRQGRKVGGGWHFTLTGDIERRVENLLGYEDKERVFHGEGDAQKLAEYIKGRMDDHLGFGMAKNDKYNHKKVQPVEIDDSFPQYLQDNIDKYRDLIRE